MSKWTRKLILTAAKEAAAQAAGPLTKQQFFACSGINAYHLLRLFPEGGWMEVRRLAGLGRHPRHRQPLSDDELLQQFHEVAAKLRAIPSVRQFARVTTLARADTLQRRFGRTPARRRRYREWLEKNHPASPLLRLLARDADEAPVPPASAPKINAGMPRWPKKAGIVRGAPIPLRGLRYAPTNEQGVIYLFGLLSERLGFIVEGMHSGYPDCEATRCIDRRLDRWQPVRIEFEFVSSNFHDHGHDPAGCDLIVCWQHDWRECPLEVIELRAVVEQMRE